MLGMDGSKDFETILQDGYYCHHLHFTVEETETHGNEFAQDH